MLLKLYICVVEAAPCPYLAILPLALAGVTLGARSKLPATVASFKADGEGAEGRALWWWWPGETALTLPEWVCVWPRWFGRDWGVVVVVEWAGSRGPPLEDEVRTDAPVVLWDVLVEGGRLEAPVGEI